MARKPKEKVSDTEEGSVEEPSSSVSESNDSSEVENSHIEEAAGPKKETPEKEVPQQDGVVEVKAGDLASMTSGLPEPNQNAIDAEKAKKEGSKVGSGRFSKNRKEEFDPEFHAVDKDGNPIPTKAGGFRKKPGRKSGRLESRKTDKEQAKQVEESENREALVRSSAFAASQMTQVALQMALSMQPDPNEKKALFESYKEYYEFAGPSKMPPWMAPILVTGSIIANHVEDEAPKTRIEKIKEWVGIRIARLRNKKGKKSNEDSKQ